MTMTHLVATHNPTACLCGRPVGNRTVVTQAAAVQSGGEQVTCLDCRRTAIEHCTFVVPPWD